MCRANGIAGLPVIRPIGAICHSHGGRAPSTVRQGFAARKRTRRTAGRYRLRERPLMRTTIFTITLAALVISGLSACGTSPVPSASGTAPPADRKSVGQGKSVSVREDHGGGRMKKKKK